MVQYQIKFTLTHNYRNIVHKLTNKMKSPGCKRSSSTKIFTNGWSASSSVILSCSSASSPNKVGSIKLTRKNIEPSFKCWLNGGRAKFPQTDLRLPSLLLHLISHLMLQILNGTNVAVAFLLVQQHVPVS